MPEVRGMTGWLSVKEIADLLSLKADSTVSRRAKREGWPYRSRAVRGGQGRLYPLARLPGDVQLAYAASLQMSLEELRGQLKPEPKPGKKASIPRYSGRGAKTAEVKSMGDTPEEYLRIASARRLVIEAYSESSLTAGEFVRRYRGGEIAPDIRARLGKHGDISHASGLYRWLGRYERHGLAGLAPQYARRRGGPGASLGGEAKEMIHSLWLDMRRPSIRSVARDLRQFGYELSYSAISRYIRDGIPPSVKTFYRKGEKAYHDRFDPYIKRDYTLFKAMEWGVADHHLFDFVVTHKGRIFRPWLTAFMDMRSRKITGWHIDVVPNTLTIIRALAMSVEACGTFGNLLIDNGKDFRSHWFAGGAWKSRESGLDEGTCDLVSGVLHDCGTRAHFCLPYRGQSKPIERLFGTVCELFSKRMDTYVGSNTATRPDEAKLYWGRINGRDKIEVALTLEETRRRFAEFALWYNTQWAHSGQGMGGRTPEQVFEACRGERREVPDELRRYIFSRREKRTVQRRGVTIDGIEYYNPALAQHIGTQVEVRRDINRLGAVSIFSLPERVFLMDAESDVLKDFGAPEENLRAQRTAQRKARGHLAKHARDAAIIRLVKSPAELMAEEAAAKAEEAGPAAMPIAAGGESHAPKRKKYKGIFD